MPSGWSSLSSELQQRIFYYARNDAQSRYASPRHAALVCSGWREQAQAVLFSDMFLKRGRTIGSAIQALSDNPKLRRYVKRLCCWVEGTAFTQGTGTSIRSELQLVPPDRIPHILRLIPTVTVLDLVIFSFTPQDFSTIMCDRDGDGRPLSIESLALRSPAAPIPRSKTFGTLGALDVRLLSAFLASCPNLRLLAMAGLTLFGWNDPSRPLQTVVPALQEIELYDNALSDDHFRWLCSAAGSLRKVGLLYGEPRGQYLTASGTVATLRAHGRNVDFLRVDFADFEDVHLRGVVGGCPELRTLCVPVRALAGDEATVWPTRLIRLGIFMPCSPAMTSSSGACEGLCTPPPSLALPDTCQHVFVIGKSDDRAAQNLREHLEKKTAGQGISVRSVNPRASMML